MEAWIGHVDGSGALVWELTLLESGPISALFVVDDTIRVLQRNGADSVVHDISSSGQHVATTKLVSASQANFLATTAAQQGEDLFVGGVSDQDFWIGHVDGSGQVQAVVKADYLGFTDTVVGLISTDAGFVATVRAGATPGSVGGDNQVQETTDTIVVFYDRAFNELHREIFSHDEDYVSTIPNVTIGLDDGSIIVGGYRTLSQETGDWTAWAARTSVDGTVWNQEWAGPEERTTIDRLATIETIREIEPGVLIMAGRQSAADGIQRWHIVAHAADGTVELEELGEAASGAFDSYLASSTSGPARLVGNSVLSEGSVQWSCEFSI